MFAVDVLCTHTQILIKSLFVKHTVIGCCVSVVVVYVQKNSTFCVWLVVVVLAVLPIIQTEERLSTAVFLECLLVWCHSARRHTTEDQTTATLHNTLTKMFMYNPLFHFTLLFSTHTWMYDFMCSLTSINPFSRNQSFLQHLLHVCYITWWKSMLSLKYYLQYFTFVRETRLN